MAQPCHIVVNAQAGGFGETTPETLAALLRQTLPGLIATMTFETGDRIVPLVEMLLERTPAPLLIGGGDGTIAGAATVAARHGQPIGILPLGTMNLLATDLGLMADLPSLLPGYRDPHVLSIDAGSVADRLFLCNAVIGIVPETAISREAARRDHSARSWLDFAGTLASGLAGQDTRSLTLTCNGETFTIDVAALVISNNRFAAARNSTSRYRRASLTGGELVVYGIRPHGLLDATRLLFKLWNGAWHEDDTVFSFSTKEITVAVAEPDLLLSLDGEPVTLPAPATFTCLPHHLQILLPGGAA